MPDGPTSLMETGKELFLFPMMTLSLKIFLGMTTMQSYEELKDSLVQFEESMGKAMFVSHQWVTAQHPDPEFTQLGVLQKALQNLISGRSQVSISIEFEIAFGRVECPKAADFADLYIWYDYFSCPQGLGAEASAQREVAITCIPAYVAKCVFFVLLCPSLHFKGHNLNHSTLAARGWCRLEQLASHLDRDDGFSILIKTPEHPTLVHNTNGLCRPPGTGDFSFESDRQIVGVVVLQMLWKKLHSLLDKGEFAKYRFLLNLHGFYLQGLDQQAFEGLVPGFHTEIDASTDADAFLIARFLHDNCFRSIFERDSAGWSPLCYAVLTGNCSLVRALLSSRADANDFITKRHKGAALPKHLPILSLAARYHSNEVVHLLVSAGASVNARCEIRATALTGAALSDNAAAVQILLEAGVDSSIRASVGVSPFRLACGVGSVGVMKEMLRLIPEKVSLRFALHSALAFSGSIDTISCLIEASADVNERLCIPMSRTKWWVFMRALHATHYASPSCLTYLAYHHYGATPLIFSVLTGKFEAIPVLLAAGAKMDIPNDRGKTAAHFLQQMNMSLASSEDVVSRLSSQDSDDTISV